MSLPYTSLCLLLLNAMDCLCALRQEGQQLPVCLLPADHCPLPFLLCLGARDKADSAVVARHSVASGSDHTQLSTTVCVEPEVGNPLPDGCEPLRQPQKPGVHQRLPAGNGLGSNSSS